MEEKLVKEAKKVVGQFKLNSFKTSSAGVVATALITKGGSIYTGINLDMPCGIGFCAEASAIAEMLKHRETEIDMIVAITDKGNIIPPCGRCRELLYQTDKKNLDTKVIISEGKIKILRELLPDTWADKF